MILINMSSALGLLFLSGCLRIKCENIFIWHHHERVTQLLHYIKEKTVKEKKANHCGWNQSIPSNPSLPILPLTILSRASCRLSWFRPGWLVWTLRTLCMDQTQAQMPVNLQTEPGEESPKHSRSQTHSSLPSWGTWTDRLHKQRRMGLVVTHFTSVKNPQGKSTSL